MIVFTTKVNWEKVKSMLNYPDRATEYVESLIPKWAKHIPGIINNQKYFVALHIRGALSLPYKSRMAFVNNLVDSIHLTGVLTDFVALDEMLELTNKTALASMLEGDLYEK